MERHGKLFAQACAHRIERTRYPDLVPSGVGNGVPVGGKAELVDPVVAVGVVPTDVVVVLVPVPEGEDDVAALAADVVGVAVVVTGVDIINRFNFGVNYDYFSSKR